MSEQRCVQVLNAGLHDIFERRDDVYLLGEDLLDPYGGAFKVSAGLSTRWPDRVLTTPVSEAGMFGIAAGMALRGYRPIVEIMFGDFIALGFDQIVNGIAKFREMFDEQVTVPLVVRTPMGGAPRLRADAQPVAREVPLGVPGHRRRRAERVPRHRRRCSRPRSPTTGPCSSSRTSSCTAVRTAGRSTAASAIRGAHRDEGPLAGADLLRQRLRGRRGDDRHVRRDAAGRARAATRLILEEEIFTEVVALGRLLPLDLEPVLESVARTGALVTVEEGTLTAGVGAEIAARVQEAAWEELRAPVRRVAAPDGIFPAAADARGGDAPGRGRRRRCGRAACSSDCSRSSSRARTRTASPRSSSSGSSTTAQREQGPAGVRRRDVEGGDRDRGAGRRDALPARAGGDRGRARQQDRASSPRTTTEAVAEPSEVARAAQSPRPAGPANVHAQGGRARGRARHRPRRDRRRPGFITAEDVEALDPRRRSRRPCSSTRVLAGLSTRGRHAARVVRPSTTATGALDEAFLAELRADPAAFGALSSEEKVAAYRAARRA